MGLQIKGMYFSASNKPGIGVRSVRFKGTRLILSLGGGGGGGQIQDIKGVAFAMHACMHAFSNPDYFCHSSLTN